MKSVFFLFIVFASSAEASELRLESGVFQTVSNRFNIPNPGGTRFGIKEENAKFYGRFQFTLPVSDNGSVRFLLAPLETGYSFQSGSASVFNGATFPANSQLDVTYRFNSYRVGYIYRFISGKSFEAQFGGIGKVRQAKISVSGAGISKTYSNVGFVPLLNFGFRWIISGPWEIRFDIDGAAAKQGRAFDGSLELFYLLSKAGTGISGGIRVLEGGADNEKVNTFALLQYAFASFTYGF